MDFPITAETKVLGTVSFKEPSGSSFPYGFGPVTIASLGVVPAGTPNQMPTEDEITSATTKMKAGDGHALEELSAKYVARNAMAGANPLEQIRVALISFFQKGGLEGHPIDNEKYVWSGDTGALTLTGETDDEKGAFTGTPLAKYIRVSGAAVWG